MKSWVPIPILIPVNRGANPGFFPDPGQIGIPRFPGIPAQSGSGQNPEYFPDPGPIGIGKIPAIFPAKSGRGGAGFGDLGVWLEHQDWARLQLEGRGPHAAGADATPA